MSLVPRARKRRARHLIAMIAAVTALLMVLLSVANQPVSSAAPTADGPDSGFGITVHHWRFVTGRTMEVDISTDAVDPGAVHGAHQVRITLPDGYDQNPDTRYPVLYLLHGGAGGRSSGWTADGGDAERITAGQPIITVMPDGGKVGWYNNWADQSSGAQDWQRFHTEQLIQWIDANMRTIANKGGRAIAGLSMGGFGAIHYAQQRPDLYAYAASFSGALDLENSSIQTVIGQQAAENGYSSQMIFGGDWAGSNPLRRAQDLNGVAIALYAGSGIHDFDVIERTVGWSTHRMHEELDRAGIPHFYWMYGRPGPSVPYGCDGGHNFTCWNFALNDVLPRMLEVLEHP